MLEASTDQTNWESGPVTVPTDDSVYLRATITGFQCSALFDAAQPAELGEKLLFEQNPLPSSGAFVEWTCAGDLEEATATGWAAYSTGEITFTVRLNLDGDPVLNPSIGEVEKSLTVTWQD